MKFIENQGIEDTLYSYEYSDDQIKIINEKRGSEGSSFSEEPQTGGSATQPAWRRYNRNSTTS